MLQKEFWWNFLVGECFIFFVLDFFFGLILHACVINNLGRQGLGCV